MDPETFYRQLGRLIETMPNLPYEGSLTQDDHLWLGRADALVVETGNAIDIADWRRAVANLRTYSHDANALRLVLYRLLARAELRAPAGARGAFIPVGGSFDAYAAIAKILGPAKQGVLIIDPYLDETVLTQFAGTIPEKVPLRLLADGANYKPSLKPAAERWTQQHGATRPLAVRLAAARTLHDRAIFVDGKTAWTVTQSLKDIANRSPAEIVKADDTAALKIAAYEQIWNTAQVLV